MNDATALDKMQQRRTRIQKLLSWFGVFQAKGIMSNNLTTTRRELEIELAGITTKIKKTARNPGHEQTNMRTHS